MSCSKLRTRLVTAKGERNVAVRTYDIAKHNLKAAIRTQHTQEKVQVILRTVARQTQEQLQYHISELVSLALDAIFPDPYECIVNFVEKRGKTEAEIKLKKDGEELDPLDSTGGGVVDVAAFALRVSLWSIQNPRTRSTLVMDEPFRFVSKNLRPKIATLLQELSKKLKLQFIIVTHDPELVAGSNILTVAMMGGKSVVESTLRTTNQREQA